MTLKAKNIVENRFWIIENDKGERIGNIAQTTTGIRCTVDDSVEVFPDMQEMMQKKNIVISRKIRENKTIADNEVYGFPTSHTAYNQIWNVKLKLPIYTKNNKSSSYFCAGYYVVKYDKVWVAEYCPKFITLQRYQYYGPYKSKIEQSERLRNVSNETA